MACGEGYHYHYGFYRRHSLTLAFSLLLILTSPSLTTHSHVAALGDDKQEGASTKSGGMPNPGGMAAGGGGSNPGVRGGLSGTSSANDGCSRVCQCHYMDDDLSAHCVRMSLTRVPPDIPLNVTILDLSLNNITVLSVDAFSSPLPTLQRLDLRMNGLSDVRPGAFSRMPRLSELGLDHNELMALRSGVFSELSALSVLSLNNNKIASIENGTFEGLVLKHLNLHDNNPLQLLEAGIFTDARVETLSLDRCAVSEIHVDAFQPLADSIKNVFFSHNLRPLHIPARTLQGLDLNTLWLADNKLTDLGFLAHTKVLHLDLSDNPLGEVDMGAYLAMEHVELFNLSQSQLRELHISGGRILFNLQELDVSDNFLRNIEGTLFQRMPSLTRLDISGNQLHYIGASLHLILYQLEYWDLTGNRLLCDCRLEWFRRWASTQNKTHLQGAVCGLPQLEPVVGAEEFTCQPPTILRISSDAVEGTWHLQCDAEGWPTPRIAWSYNISRHLGVRVDERWIAFHGHPFRNSSMLVITDTVLGRHAINDKQNGGASGGFADSGQPHHRPPAEYCFHFTCSAFNSEGHDRTEYVHCAERYPSGNEKPNVGLIPVGYPAAGMELPPETIEEEVGFARSGAAGTATSNTINNVNSRRRSSPNDDNNINSSDIFVSRQGSHSGSGSRRSTSNSQESRPSSSGSGATPVRIHRTSSDSISVSVALSSAALICLILLVLLGGVLYCRRRGDRSLLARGNPGWEQPGDSGQGEGMLTDSTKCLVEHNEGAEKATFSMDTV